MMNKYLLDTNVLIDMARGLYGIREKIITVGHKNCYISAVSIAELQTGYELTQNADELRNLKFCKENFTILPVNDDILYKFSQMKAHQIATGKKVPDFDLLIAATSSFYKIAMVSNDEKHFSLIDNFKFTNWKYETL